MSFIYSLADTWNNAGTTFNSILMNVSNGAGGAPSGAAASRILNLQANSSTVFDVDVAGKAGIGTAAVTGAFANLAAGTTAIAPLLFNSGTNLTSAVAGANEFDGVQHSHTIDTTSGRAAVAAEQYFHLTGDGSTISTIAKWPLSTDMLVSARLH